VPRKRLRANVPRGTGRGGGGIISMRRSDDTVVRKGSMDEKQVSVRVVRPVNGDVEWSGVTLYKYIYVQLW